MKQQSKNNHFAGSTANDFINSLLKPPAIGKKLACRVHVVTIKQGQDEVRRLFRLSQSPHRDLVQDCLQDLRVVCAHGFLDPGIVHEVRADGIDADAFKHYCDGTPGSTQS